MSLAADLQELRKTQEVAELDIQLAVWGPYIAAIALAIGLALVAFPKPEHPTRPHR